MRGEVTARPAAPRHADRHRRRLRQLRHRVVRPRRTPARADVARPISPTRVQEPDGRRERGDVVARPRVPARHDLGVRTASTTSWQDYWQQAAGERRARRRRLERGVRHRLHRGRQQRRPPDRRVVRVEPAGRRRVLRRREGDTPNVGVDRRRRASTRSSSRACCTNAKNPAGRAGADRLHAVARGSRKTCRCRCTCIRSSRARRCPTVFTKWAVVPPQPYAMDPQAIGAQPRRVDQGVDGDRRCDEVRPMSTRVCASSASSIPLGFFARLLRVAARARSSPARSTRARCATRSATPSLRHVVVVHVVAGGRSSTLLTLAGRAARGVRRRALRLSGPARRSARS